MKNIVFIALLLLTSGNFTNYNYFNQSKFDNTSIKIKNENNIFNINNNEDELYYESDPDDFFEQVEDTGFISNPNFLENYYLNLVDNKPNNKFGICGYTAISMLLSFYDTYWNDSIIAEKHDAPAIFDGSTFYNNEIESPGVQNDTMPSKMEIVKKIKPSDMTINEFMESEDFNEVYKNAVIAEVNNLIENDTFLGKLLSIAIDNGHIDLSNMTYDKAFGVNFKIMNSVINSYIEQNDSISNKITLFSNKLKSDSPEEKTKLRNEIIFLINQGKPVIVGGDGFNDTNNNGILDDDIDRKYSHVLVAYKYDEQNDIIFGNMGWSKSYNYVNIDEYFNLKIADYYSLKMNSLVKERTNNYYSRTERKFFSAENEAFSYETIINQADYGFPQIYTSNFNDMYIFHEHSNIEHVGLKTRRYRTGFIQNEYVVMSPIRTGFTYALFEYRFDVPVFQIDVELTHWREVEFDILDNTTGMAEFQVRTDANKVNPKGQWVQKLDLLSDETNLSRDRKFPENYAIYFDEPVYGFRFYAKVNHMIDTNHKNRGRICIGKMVVYSS